MRYEGPLTTVQSIERLVRAKSPCLVTKEKLTEPMFNVETAVKYRQLSVLVPNNLYMFSIWVVLDERDGTGRIEVKDRDVWRLCKIAPEILKLIANLEPHNDNSRQRLPGQIRPQRQRTM